MERVIYKTPAEIDFFNLNYCDALAGDTINSSLWGSTDGTLTVNTPAPSVIGLMTQVWLAGGTLNSLATAALITNGVQSNGGRDLQNSIKVVVWQYNFVDQFSVKTPIPFMVGQLADYTLDWHKRLLNGGDTIATSSWSASSSAVNVNAGPNQIGTPATSATVWLLCSTPGTYIITNTITTALGRTLEMSFLIVVLPFVTVTKA